MATASGRPGRSPASGSGHSFIPRTALANKLDLYRTSRKPMAVEAIGLLDGVVADNEMTPLVQPPSAKDKQTAREEATGILQLAGPLMGAAAVSYLPSIATSMLLGNVSATESANILAAKALAEVSQVLSSTLMGGVGSALATLSAQSFGAQQLAQLCIYTQAAILAYAYVVPVLMVLYFNGATLLELLGQDAALAQVAGVFLRIDAVSLPLGFAAGIAHCALTSQRIVAPLVIVPLVGGAVRLPLAYALGYHTHLGYVGVALAGVVSTFVTTAVLVFAAWKTPAFQHAWPGWQWREAHAQLVRVRSLGAASMVMAFTQTLVGSANAVICGYLPNAAQVIAASDIADSLTSLASIPGSGIDSSGAIRVGNALGGNAPRRARIGSVMSIALATGIGAFGAIVGAFVASFFAHSSTSNTATAEAAVSLYYAIMVSVPLTGWMLGTEGVLLACGKQAVVATLSFVCLIVVGAPLAYTLGVGYGLGSAGVWFGTMIGMLVYNVAGASYLVRLDWRQVAQDAYENTHTHAPRKASVA